MIIIESRWKDFLTIVLSYVNEAKIEKVDTKLVDTVALPMTYVT